MSNAVKQFFDAWGEADSQKQADQIAAVLSPEARYVDPRTSEPLIGPQAVAGYVSQFTAMAPGAVAEAVDVGERDGVMRATVEFRMADGMVQLGQYFVEADEAGNLTRLVGFVGTGTPG